MVGPLTASKTQALLHSNFHTSPLGLILKSGSPGCFRVIHNLSYQGSATHSVNDYIPCDLPTHWVGFDDRHTQPLLPSIVQCKR
jgi:hypothetical protein